MNDKKELLQRIFGIPLTFLGVIGAVFGLIFCLIVTLALIVGFNETAPTIIFGGAAVFVIWLLYRSYRKNQYWSGK